MKTSQKKVLKDYTCDRCHKRKYSWIVPGDVYAVSLGYQRKQQWEPHGILCCDCAAQDAATMSPEEYTLSHQQLK